METAITRLSAPPTTPALETLVGYFHGPPYNVKLWELWNEPNAYASCTGSVCSGESFIYPSNFAALLAGCTRRIKVTDGFSDVTLISGGIFGHSIGGAYSAANAGAPYLSSTYVFGVGSPGQPGPWATIRAGTGSYPLDAIGQHIYVDQGGYSTPANVQAYADWLRSAYAAYEGATTPKRTIVTEAGWATGGTGVAAVSAQQQAANVDALYWGAAAAPYVSTVTWFQLQDNPAGNLYYGLYDRSWNPKAALARFQGQ